jgi:transcriptional regulator GlxA family with amidase domain
VSPRTLERLLHRHTAHTPAFWRSLARVRQTARCLAGQPHWSLAEVAALHHWADQSHMNLAFRHWLGCTPRQLQRDPQRLGLLLQSGYGDQGLITP